MMFPQIRCYHSAINEQPLMFFILSKGENAGKPGKTPWPNSFAVLCNNQESYDFYYWLISGLYKAGKFKPLVRGSVIPFVNLNDVKDVVRDVAPTIFAQWSQFKQLVKSMELLETAKTTLGDQLINTQSLQQLLIRKFFEIKK